MILLFITILNAASQITMIKGMLTSNEVPDTSFVLQYQNSKYFLELKDKSGNLCKFDVYKMKILRTGIVIIRAKRGQSDCKDSSVLREIRMLSINGRINSGKLAGEYYAYTNNGHYRGELSVYK